MTDIESLKNIIAGADETRLRELVIDWIGGKTIFHGRTSTDKNLIDFA